jgi:Cd2+/Zn2+-exporting ATPase
MKEVLQLKGLDCAACAIKLEKQIAEIDGINSASIAFVTQKLTIDYQTDEALQNAIATANAFEDVRVEEKEQPVSLAQKGEKWAKDWLPIFLSVGLFAIGLLMSNLLKNIIGQIVGVAFYAAAYLIVGYPILRSTVKNITKGKIFDENFLMTVASIGAAFLGEYSEAVLVMLLYQIGETLQTAAVQNSRRSVTELMQLKSESATVFRGKEQLNVQPEEIKIGDILMVKSGEKVPVDGVLIDRTATLDTKSLTGESQPREVKTGEQLLSGCINSGNAFTMRATHCYQDSAAKKILDLVENASLSKAAPEKFITKFARWYTPTVCVLALALAFIFPAILGISTDGRLYLKDFTRWAQSALTFLVISCPCALVISVPLTYFSGIGACAKEGILTKGATHLDVIAQAKTIAFDKTGTLTEGNFSVIDVRENEGVDKEDLLALVTAVERASAHPIAKAFETCKTQYEAKDVQERAGRGLIAQVGDSEVLVGTVELLRERGVAFKRQRGAYTMLYVAKDKKWLGVVEVGDKLRDNVKDTLTKLKECGVTRLVMLTGDNEERAYKIANKVGVNEVYAELLPNEKWKKAEELKEQGTLVYVGDGINDAPVMAASDCAVSMGKIGSAAAVEASDLVLIRDDLSALPKCIKIAKITRSIVLQNIIFSIVMKVAFMVLGAFGVLPLWLAVFADVGVMLLAVCNSFRVRR